MRLTRRNFLQIAGLTSAGLILGTEVSPPMRALRILAPNRSVPIAAMREFTRHTGVQVISDPTPLRYGDYRQLSVISNLVISNYDVVIAPSYTLTHLIRNDLVRELEPTTSHQLPATNDQRPYDPFNSFSVLAARGIIGINARGITPPQTWKEFFTLAQRVPTYLPPLESLNAAIKSLGDSINTRNTYIREQAQSLISNLKSSPLSQSQLALSPPIEGWTFVAPHEGVELWEDNFCIPRSSQHVDLAQKFIEFALERQKMEKVEGEMLSAFSLTVLTL